MARHRAKKYGEARVSDWADRYSKSIPLLSFEYTHKSAYGKFSFDLFNDTEQDPSSFLVIFSCVFEGIFTPPYMVSIQG